MIEPALSGAEWVDVETAGGCHMDPPEDWSHGRSQYAGAASAAAQEGLLHRAAALCLDGQEYGFTWEDVRRHRREAARLAKKMEMPVRTDRMADGRVRLLDDPQDIMRESGDMLAWHESMADRIEALLRPEAG